MWSAARLALVGIFFVALVAGGLLLTRVYREHAQASDARREELVSELGRLTPPSGTTFESSSSDSKPGSAGAAAAYRTRLSYVDLRTYYDAEFRSLGWEFVSERSRPGWTINCYRKGDWYGSLEVSTNGPDFTLGLWWGSPGCG
jgi:hypothetical protein